jgi:hypothetical protein
MSYDDGEYLNDEVYVPQRVEQALGLSSSGLVGVKRFQVGDALAKELRLPREPLLFSGYMVLEHLLPELEDILEHPEITWTDLVEQDRHGQIARRVTARLDLYSLVEAMREFGWGGTWLPAKTEVRNLEHTLRELLAKQLADRLHTMLERWRDQGLWSKDATLGILTPRGRTRQSGVRRRLT